MAFTENEYDKPGSLLKETTSLLQDRNLVDISYETRLKHTWLLKFKQGKMENPSVNRVQFLYEFLTKTKIL